MDVRVTGPGAESFTLDESSDRDRMAVSEPPAARAAPAPLAALQSAPIPVCGERSLRLTLAGGRIVDARMPTRRGGPQPDGAGDVLLPGELECGQRFLLMHDARRSEFVVLPRIKGGASDEDPEAGRRDARNRPPDLTMLSRRQLERVVRRLYGLNQHAWVTSDPLHDPASGRVAAVPAELGPLTRLMRLPNLKALEQIVGGYVDARFVHALIVSNRMAERSSQPEVLRAVVAWWATRAGVRMTRGSFDKDEFVDEYIEQVRAAMARKGIQRLPFPHLRELRLAEDILRRVGAEAFWKGPFRGERASIEQIKRAAHEVLGRHSDDEPDVVVLSSATALAETRSAVGVDNGTASPDDATVLKRFGERASHATQRGTVQAHQTYLRAFGVWLQQNHPERGALAAIEQADPATAQRWVNEYRDAIGRLSPHGIHINGAVAALRGEAPPKRSRALSPADRAVLERFGRAAAVEGLTVGVVKAHQTNLRRLSHWLDEHHSDQEGLTGIERGDAEAVGALLQAFRETNQAPGIDDAVNTLRNLRQT